MRENMTDQCVTQCLARDITIIPSPLFEYTFCTLVTRPQEYQEMVQALVAKGFTTEDCEFLFVDNSVDNRFDAFSAYNRFLQEAQGRYIVLCHQDILPLDDGRAELDKQLEELNAIDADWGLCGNAGRLKSGELAIRISHPDEPLNKNGPFPKNVMSLDENFIIARREANLALSHDLTGFHWYGADLCIIADILGWRSYVIDFHLLHKSTGKIDESFRSSATAFRLKFSNAFRPRWQHVPTSHPLFISSSRTLTFLARAANRIKASIGAVMTAKRP